MPKFDCRASEVDPLLNLSIRRLPQPNPDWPRLTWFNILNLFHWVCDLPIPTTLVRFARKFFQGQPHLNYIEIKVKVPFLVACIANNFTPSNRCSFFSMAIQEAKSGKWATVRPWESNRLCRVPCIPRRVCHHHGHTALHAQ
jgi:hypothetical protein